MPLGLGSPRDSYGVSLSSRPGTLANIYQPSAVQIKASIINKSRKNPNHLKTLSPFPPTNTTPPPKDRDKRFGYISEFV